MNIHKLSLTTFICLMINSYACASAVITTTEEIKNPYHKNTKWRLWANDPTPIKTRYFTLALPANNKRLYPDASKGIFDYRKDHSQIYDIAGSWDDVYASFDNAHSYMPNKWDDDKGNSISVNNHLCI